MPELTPDEFDVVRDIYNNLRKVYASVKEMRKQPELTSLVMRLLSASPFGTRSDEMTQSMRVDVWVEQLEKYPMWAIKKAYDWQFEDSSGKEVILAQFIQDVKLACGSPYNDKYFDDGEPVKYRMLHEIVKNGGR